MNFLTPIGLYYEGERVHPLDQEVPQRPSPDHIWSGSAWTIDQVAVLDRKAAFAVDGIDRLQFEHLFDLENRMRAQEGIAQITRAQYRTALINRWKQLNS